MCSTCHLSGDGTAVLVDRESGVHCDMVYL